VSYRQVIHDLLVTTADGGTFSEATYTKARPSLLVEGDPITPASAEANEIRGAYGVDDEYGREFRQKRTGWAWLLVIRFDTEAILEDFERALMRTPLTIPQDISDDRDQQVILLLEDSSYEHPPRGGASNGTEVTYRFVAQLCQQ
jgi:hypothetical protein